MSRANIIKCSGLRTFSNELDMEPGSLRQALNVNVDEKGVITPRRGFNDYGNPTNNTESTGENFVSQIMEYKNAIIRQYQNKIEFENTSGQFEAVNGDYNPTLEGFRTKWQEASSNLFFTSDEGIKKISVTNRTALNSDMITQAGGIKAGYASGKSIPTIGGFLPPSSKVAYRVVYGTKDASGNLIEGSPSSRFIVTNFSEAVEVYEKSSITFTTQVAGADPVADPEAKLKDGDYVVYNTASQKYVIFFDVTGTADEPQTLDTIGASYIKVAIPSTIADAFNNGSIAAITANVLSSQLANSTITADVSGAVLITATEEGDLTNIGTPVTTDADVMTSSTVVEGNTTSGTDATVSITGVVPNEATTKYFYQVYRTGVISTSIGLDINDIDPGDEMNIVYESGLIQEEREFTFVDTTPESFRAEGTPLYTNAVTGQGILQANEAPPISLDIELFRNYMFYGNTKQRHKIDFTIVSVDDFVSGSTRFIVGSSDISRYYTFTGSAQVTDVTIGAIPTAGDYINLFSASDERQYYIYFGGSGDDPLVAGALGYLIDTTGLTTGAEVASLIEEVLSSNVDFDLSVASDVITFTHANNGYTTGITNGVGTDITIAIPSTGGTGELAGTDEGGDVLLSGLVSVGQSIDETARSLVKIISQDSQSPVNAYYISSGEDLPGNILLEARSLEDKTIYIAIETSYDEYDELIAYDKGDRVTYENRNYEAKVSSTGSIPDTSPTEWTLLDLGDEFTPTLPNSKSIEGLTGNGGSATITLSNHGYTTGDQVYVGYFQDPSFPSDPLSFSDVYTVTVDNINTFTIDAQVDNSVMGFVPAFSTVFSPDVASDNETKTNRIYYSKVSQPEAVPSVNFIDVGTQDGQIRRILALRDNLFILKDDGIFILSGTSAPDWSVRLLDNTKIIAPDSAVVLNNQIYCLTEQGITRISDSGVAVISRGIENLIDKVTNQDFDYASNTFGIPYENDRAFLLFMPQDETDSSATQAFRYNIFEQTWTRWEYEAKSGHVLSRDNKLYIGNGDRNYISQERKNDDRTDHSDRDFTNSILTSGVSGSILQLGSLTNIKAFDVVTQQQDVTITFINDRILRKMDLFDTGVTPPASSTMFDSFQASVGDDLSVVMQSINDHLNGLDPANITAKSFTLSNIRTETQNLVNELNSSGSLTSIKTYKDPYTVFYEGYIKSIDLLRNQVTLHTDRPFVAGEVVVYKGYTCTVEWNPQHFGDPSATKQISYITIMFDQNNFYEAVAKFASDVSQAVTEVSFKGKGIGYWGDLPWGTPNHYWGGNGNDVPFRNPVPRNKQKCRYLSLTFEHKNAREDFRVVGISGEVRAISGRGYRNLG